MPYADEVDLSGTKFDGLETDLSKRLGLKVILLRGWSTPRELSQADAEFQFAKTPETRNAALAKYLAAEERMRASLRASIAGRDPATGSEITDSELNALHEGRHVTLRKGNAEPIRAVIIFDPVSAPAQNIATIAFSNADGSNRKTVELTSGGPVANPELPKDAALQMALDADFSNLWQQFSKDRKAREIPVENFVENFDIDIDDLRRYKALVNVRYALQHQTEYISHPGRSGQPEYLHLARLAPDFTKDIDTPSNKRWYRDVFNEVSSIDNQIDAAKDFGMKDKKFFEKLKLAVAVMDLVNGYSSPNGTFARLKSRDEADHKVIEATRGDLYKRISAKIKEKFPRSFDLEVRRDWRMLFPVFREVYEEDKSKGVQREYLTTIMKGLQKYFPTLTNGPVPAYQEDKPEGEPPRSLPQTSATPQKRQTAGPKA